MLTNIAIFLVVLATIGNSILILYVSRKKDYNGRFITEGRLRDDLTLNIRRIEDKLKKVQPLIDNYEKELNDKAWESYRKWKAPIIARLDTGGEGCAQCYEDSLEIKTTRKSCFDIEFPIFMDEESNGYPLTAQLKCTECGHVVDQWEFKEDAKCSNQ